MKKIIACICLMLFFSTVTAHAAERLRIIAGTSLISDIVSSLTEGHSDILTLIQGSSCPGHENANTGDYVFAATAKLLLIHPFQRHLPQVRAMLKATDNAGLTIVEVSPRGSWLIPDVQKTAVLEIAEALKNAAPDLATSIDQQVQARLHAVDAAAAACLSKLKVVQGKRVIAATMQAEFARWAGLEVVQTFGRAEDVTARGLTEILAASKGANLSGVIDNYQSGPDTGLPLALELGVPHVVLSNFPGSSADVPDYFSLLRHNVALLQML